MRQGPSPRAKVSPPAPLAALRDVIVGVVEGLQSKSGDFYRELGDIFSVQLRPSNRWGARLPSHP